MSRYANSASRREFVFGAGAASLACSSKAALPSDSVTPEMFGAKGDGRTNDTRAFAAMSAHVNSRGGGTIVLRPVTYMVGAQRRTPPGARDLFEPADIIRLTGCNGPITIKGNGAKLRCAPGLRYGRFDRASGAPLPAPAKPDFSSRGIPYTAMINIEACSGAIAISDLELDGSLRALEIGGPSGKGSWQAGASGIRLAANRGAEQLSRIHSHHHAQDGIILNALPGRLASSTVSDVLCEDNGRQGCSIVGGRNFVLERSTFRRSGKSGLRSPPCAGVDIEAESSPIRNVTFRECEFSDNAGVAAGTRGDVADVHFNACKLIGTTATPAWPISPRMRFDDCLFVGSLLHAYGDADPAQAAQFHDCTFTDDPAASPTGVVFLAQSGRWIVALEQRPNVLFSHCHFRLVGQGALPHTGPDVIYADCDMVQRSRLRSSPRGTYFGTNSIRGNADLSGSIIRGTVDLNGRVLPQSR